MVDFKVELDHEAILAQFNRLMQELMRGSIARNSFRPWEIELLLDIDSCDLRDTSRRELLRRYQRIVQKQLEKGATRPMKLSEYLQIQKERRNKGAAKQVSA
jgi:hypothetical protein